DVRTKPHKYFLKLSRFMSVTFLAKQIYVQSEQVTPQVTPQVTQLLGKMEGEKSRSQLMQEVSLKDRMNFFRKYLEPALALNLIEMTQPNTPKSPTQKYRLTVKGQQMNKRGQIFNLDGYLP
ncbi:MAG: hypothetical protein U9N77_03975, partial [Thermodesulfobacteriota bacterium]|nr:hypothetical protein [Thermodesulfobacteriota bacterium]